MIAPRYLVERALARTPLPKGVALLKEQTDPNTPVLEPRGGRWVATLVYVNEDGLPIWRPKSSHRRRQRYVLEAEVSEDAYRNTVALKLAGLELVRKASFSLKCIRSGRAAHRRLLASGWTYPRLGGRPRGPQQQPKKAAGDLHHVGRR